MEFTLASRFLRLFHPPSALSCAGTAIRAREVRRMPLPNPRITSYNVCYTKLLRISAAYTGKPYDPVTGLYDYGYRDYAPSQARFTTPDPIRDGHNWFSYVNNDPVNWIDPWGLIANSITSAFKMNDNDWKDNQINNVQGSQNTLGKQGCAIDLVANISTTANGTNTTPQDLNSKTSTFAGKGSIDISWSGVGNNAGLEIERSAQYSYASLNKAAAQYKLDKAIVSPEKVYIGVQVPITVKGKVGSHWVGA